MQNYSLKFKILPHTADLKLQAFGETKEKLFLNMLLGMQESMKPEIKNKETIRREIKINSLDLSALLVDFLSEVLYLNQVNKETYFDIKFSKFTDKEIEGKLTGLKVERFDEDIKAVTHHNLNVTKNKDEVWEAVVLFDI